MHDRYYGETPIDREPEADDLGFFCSACLCSIYCFDDDCECDCHGRDTEFDDD